MKKFFSFQKKNIFLNNKKTQLYTFILNNKNFKNNI